MGALLPVLATLFDDNKVAGWVRAGVAALLGLFVAKWPWLGQIVDPTTQQAIAAVVATIVVGVWSQLTKTPAAKVAAVNALAKDPTSPVKGVLVEATVAGQQLVNQNPGGSVAIVGTPNAAVIAAKTNGAK